MERDLQDMRRVVESASVLMWIGAPDGRRRWVGPAFSALTGLSPQALAGTGWLDAVHPEDRERCVAIDALCMASDRPFTLDYRLRRHDGHFVWVMDSATPCHGADGHHEGHVGVCVDIDARRALEDELAERLRVLRDAGRI